MSSAMSGERARESSLLNVQNGVRAAVAIVILTTGLSVYVDFKDHELHTQDMNLRSSLEQARRTGIALSNMLMVTALERNILRARKYEQVNDELEQAVKTVGDLNHGLAFSGEINALLDRHQQLRGIEAQAVALMRSGQWPEARAALLDAEYVRNTAMYEIDLGTMVGAMASELDAKADLFDLLRVMAAMLRVASIILLLWVGLRYSSQLRLEVLLQTRLQAGLSASQQALRELAAHEDAKREDVRKQVAQEIHDDLGQRLTVLRMDVAMLPRAVQADPATLLPKQVDVLKRSIDGIMTVVREIAGRLRPAALEAGLGPAAESLLNEFQQAMGIPCELDDRLPANLVLDDVRTTTIFRILQESMTNAARHAQASHIRVRLSTADRGLRLTVEDDGRGFAGSRGGSYGVSGMRERAASLGGTLQISSAGGTGTTVEAWIPLDVELPQAITSASRSRSTSIR